MNVRPVASGGLLYFVKLVVASTINSVCYALRGSRGTLGNLMMDLSANPWWQRYAPIRQALLEVLLTAVIVLTPVWGGAFISIIFHEISSLKEAFVANTARGDLFLLAIAAVAPLVLYITVKRGQLPRPLTIHFPGGAFFVLCLIVIFGGSTILFSIKRAAELHGSSVKIDEDLFLKISIVTYIASIVLSLVVTSIKYQLDSIKPEDLFRADTDDFVNKWKRRPKT